MSRMADFVTCLLKGHTPARIDTVNRIDIVMETYRGGDIRFRICDRCGTVYAPRIDERRGDPPPSRVIR